MNKEELITAIAEKTNSTKVDIKKFLDGYVEVVTTALQSDDPVQLIGFGSFSVSARAEHKGRNPRTGVEITIPASKVVRFSVGKQLKEAVNK
ncbi:MAG: HU family DNA-binding protein [Rickettsiales bacterium]|jgi:DNA-binding protein HU-beta|nr:HU family DNA-binding protein [Rickettsiales bacterium]